MCIEANVPEKSVLNKFMNLTVEFPILCPQCGLQSNNLKKNGHDMKIRGHPQFFSCKTCKIHFYPHTSWIFKEFTEIVIERALKFLYVEKYSASAVAELCNTSKSTISKLQHHCTELIEYKLAIINTKTNQLLECAKLPSTRQNTIWWDETFIRINRQNYCLILIINGLGKVLAYSFSKTRTAEDYMRLLTPLLESFPNPLVIITDGFRAYESVCKQLNREVYLIQHVHSHPWEEAKLHHFIPDESTQDIHQTSVLLAYDAFTKQECQQGVVLSRLHKYKEPTKSKQPRGRPKGMKDTKKRAIYGSLKKLKEEREKKKRGPKTLKSNGIPFIFDPKRYDSGWNITLPKNSLNFPKSPKELIIDIKQLLNVTSDVMEGGFILSNYIESINRLIKSYIPDRGIKTVSQVEKLLNSHLIGSNRIVLQQKQHTKVDIAFHSSWGFNQLFQFFKTDKTQITISKEVC